MPFTRSSCGASPFKCLSSRQCLGERCDTSVGSSKKPEIKVRFGGTMQAILPSRRRVILLTLAVLMVLDLARSVEAHLGYAQVTLMWQPDPKVYADIAWPPGSDLPANATNGQRVYAQHCQVCHGPDGRGNGPAAPSLIPRPRDFTIGQFKYKTTPPDQPPSDADLIDIITNGLQASAMPFWKNTLSAADIRDVV